MNVLAQLKRELSAIFYSPIAYGLIAAALAINGITFFLILDFLSSPHAPYGAVMQWMFGDNFFFFFILIISTSLITMRSLAEEKHTGTLETLLTAPINEAQVILAKYLSLVCFFIVLWLPSLIYPIVLSRHSEIDIGPIAASYAGTLLVGMMFLAIGLLCSSVSKNQIISALLCSGTCFILIIIPLFEMTSGPGSSESPLSYINMWTHMGDFSRGIVDTRPIVFYVSIILSALFFTVQVLQSRRWRG